MTRYLYDNDDINEENKIIRKMNLGKIPIMLNSDYCILQNKEFLKDGSECIYDYGGYFIINGNEKVVVSQDRIAENRTYVFLDSKSTFYSHIREIRSVPDNMFGPPKLVTLKLSSKPTQFGKFIRTTMHQIKHEIPLFVLFRALGIESDKEIIEYICYDIKDKKNEIIIKELVGSVEDSCKITTQADALEYLSKYLNIIGYPKEFLSNKNRRINIIREILKNELLPHVGESYQKKALYLGYMTRKLLKCYLGLLPLDDRDSYINKRIETPGFLMANLLDNIIAKL